MVYADQYSPWLFPSKGVVVNQRVHLQKNMGWEPCDFFPIELTHTNCA